MIMNILLFLAAKIITGLARSIFKLPDIIPGSYRNMPFFIVSAYVAGLSRHLKSLPTISKI